MKLKYSLPALALTGLLGVGCATTETKDMDRFMGEPVNLADKTLVKSNPGYQPGETSFSVVGKRNFQYATEPINLENVAARPLLNFTDPRAYLFSNNGKVRKLINPVSIYEGRSTIKSGTVKNSDWPIVPGTEGKALVYDPLNERIISDWPVTEETRDKGQPALELKLKDKVVCVIDGKSCL